MFCRAAARRCVITASLVRTITPLLTERVCSLPPAYRRRRHPRNPFRPLQSDHAVRTAVPETFSLWRPFHGCAHRELLPPSSDNFTLLQRLISEGLPTRLPFCLAPTVPPPHARQRLDASLAAQTRMAQTSFVSGPRSNIQP